MSGNGQMWGDLRATYRQRLSWKLAFSHLQVTVLAQIINVIGIGLIFIVAGRAPASSTGNDVVEGSVILAIIIFLGILVLLVTMLSSGVAAALGVHLAHRFARRLQALARATEAITRGDLGTRVEVTDLDEIGQIAVRFNLLTQRLEEVDRARRSFVSNVSHELRTPLAIIRGHLETQLARGPGAPMDVEALETVEREVQALGALVDDLFTLTRIEEAALPIQPQPVALPELAAAAVNAIQPLAVRQGHVSVRSFVPADLAPVHVDPIRLTQILNNLLYNALRHTPDGGVIVVEARALADGATVEVAVSDTGMGIDSQDLPRIFERHFFAKDADDIDEGSGLGLAIVKQLVEAQGGTIRAESARGQGTTIRFTLPRASSGTHSTGRSRASSAGTAGND